MLTKLKNDVVIGALFNGNLLLLFIEEHWFATSPDLPHSTQIYTANL